MFTPEYESHSAFVVGYFCVSKHVTQFNSCYMQIMFCLSPSITRDATTETRLHTGQGAQGHCDNSAACQKSLLTAHTFKATVLSQVPVQSQPNALPIISLTRSVTSSLTVP
jgi:hypothetical protein